MTSPQSSNLDVRCDGSHCPQKKDTVFVATEDTVDVGGSSLSESQDHTVAEGNLRLRPGHRSELWVRAAPRRPATSTRPKPENCEDLIMKPERVRPLGRGAGEVRIGSSSTADDAETSVWNIPERLLRLTGRLA